MHYEIWVDEQLPGQVRDICPGCKRSVVLERFRLKGKIGITPLPSAEALRCVSCGAFARRESMMKRVLGAVVLTPFVILLLAGFATGAYLLSTTLVDLVRGSEWSGGFLFIGLLLMAATSFFGFRVLKFMHGLCFRKGLLPMEKLQTTI